MYQHIENIEYAHKPLYTYTHQHIHFNQFNYIILQTYVYLYIKSKSFFQFIKQHSFYLMFIIEQSIFATEEKFPLE